METRPDIRRCRSAGRRSPRLPVAGVCLALVLAGCDQGPGGDFPRPDPLTVDVGHLPPFPEEPGNPLTVQGVELGRRLFHDPILSGDRTQSCATCHDPDHAFAEPRRVSVGIDGSEGVRNAPPVINVAWIPELFWDGRVASVEDQAREPVPNPIEMKLPWPDAVARIAADPDYPDMFGRAFGTIEVTEDRVVQAIAQFERTLVSHRSRWDRKIRLEEAFTEQEIRGERLFFSEEAECFHCHGSILFTDNRYHDTGLDFSPPDPGRMAQTGNESDRGKFRTPTLRNVAETAPYMHDGRFATLEEVLEHYVSGMVRSPNLDPLLGVHQPLGLPLSAQDQADLVAFLKTLTDDEFLQNPDFRAP